MKIFSKQFSKKQNKIKKSQNNLKKSKHLETNF